MKESIFDRLKVNVEMCKKCDKRGCKRGLFNSPPPLDCPYRLERLMMNEDKNE